MTDDKDQAHTYPSDSSTGERRSRSKSQQPGDQPVPGQLAFPSTHTPGFPEQETWQRTTKLLPDPAQQAMVPTQSRPTWQTAQPPTQPPQPILFAGRESNPLASEPVARSAAPRQRLGRTRRWLRSRSGRVIIPLLTLLIGLAAGLTSVIWYGLSGEGALVTVVPAARGNVIVDANKDFVSQLIRTNLLKAGLPGKVQNIRVDLKHGASIIIQGDDVYPVFFTSITKHFTVDVQPYVHACILQVRITHADLAGIPVTTFVQTFQSQINQQLASKPAGLPGDFAYCIVGVSTEPGGMYITYQVVPVTR